MKQKYNQKFYQELDTIYESFINTKALEMGYTQLFYGDSGEAARTILRVKNKFIQLMEDKRKEWVEQAIEAHEMKKMKRLIDKNKNVFNRLKNK